MQRTDGLAGLVVLVPLRNRGGDRRGAVLVAAAGDRASGKRARSCKGVCASGDSSKNERRLGEHGDDEERAVSNERPLRPHGPNYSFLCWMADVAEHVLQALRASNKWQRRCTFA
jgi:hypothetical protein